ncbi:MAG TPA: prepilin peptidase [Candidatus Marinimicrobia bacterium]|nr:prepilin peptidase [Candidatus Neomarinimicrobiota bacterium]
MILTFVIIFGLMIGSFLNVCIYRIPREESIVYPRSRCPNCKHQLRFWENIPVLSYLFLRGQCSSCKTSISSRYIFVELLTALLFILLYNHYGWSLDFLMSIIFSCIILVITFIDIDYQIIPNQLLLIGLIPAVYQIISVGFRNSSLYFIGAVGLGLGILLISLIGNILFKKESMGMGDVKYAALIGLLLGWQNGLLAVFLAFLSSAILILILLPLGKISFGQRIPFGPFLSLGTIIALLWGPIIIRIYLNLVL